MKYVVMECHVGYAVVLDENGTFLKVANKNYEIGQTVTDVVPIAVESRKKARILPVKWVYSVTAAAACLLLVLIPLLSRYSSAVASVYLTINPEIRIDVDKNDTVVSLAGVNEDGKALISGYEYKKKHLDTVIDELIDKAIEMGFLKEGGKITLALDAKNNEWTVSHGTPLKDHLSDYLTDKVAAEVEVTDKNSGQVFAPSTTEDDDDDDDDNDDDDDDDNDDDDDDIDDGEDDDGEDNDGEDNDGEDDDDEDVDDDEDGDDPDDDDPDDPNDEDDTDEDDDDDINGDDEDDGDDTDDDEDDDDEDDDGEDDDEDRSN